MPGGAGGAAISRRNRAEAHQRALVASGADVDGPIASYYANKTRYPSNIQIWHTSKDATTNAFKPEYLTNIMFGNTPAPKGHYVLPLFYKNRQAASGITELEDMGIESTNARPSCVCSYAGRIFYSGVSELTYQGKVWFSRVVRDYLDLGRCYQEQDPTAEDFNELIATDGGEIPIPGASAIVGLVAVQNGVMAIATNGVWLIHGGDAPFTAVNYSVDKIHSSGAVSSTSFVDVEGSVVLATTDGIYVVTRSATGALSAVSLTDTSIKSFYQSISATAKAKFHLVYSREDRRLYCAYGNDDASDPSLNNILVYDFILNAWFPLSIQAQGSSPAVLSVFDKRNFSNVVVEEQVVIGNTNVVVGSNNVVVSSVFSGRTDAGIKLVTYIVTSPLPVITFSEFNSNKFVDWFSFDDVGYSYDAYVEVGPVSAGELLRTKQLLYVTTYFNVTETEYDTSIPPVLLNQSSCTLQAKWGWADDTFTGKWTTPQEAYKLNYSTVLSEEEFDYGYSVVKSKLLIRGSGRAFSLRWAGTSGKNMQLIGWAAPLKVNSGEE